MERGADNALAYANPEIGSTGAFPYAGFLTALSSSVVGVFALCFAGAVLIRYNGLFPSVIDWDESLYALMAQHWLRGGLPYEAVWDQHSVGLPALFAALLLAFPKSILAIRLSACVAVAVAATTIYFTARLIDRRHLPAIVAVVLYLAWTARQWGLAANTELYLNALLSLAMYILIREDGASPYGVRSIARLGLAGLLLGVAVHIKHVAVAETAMFFGVVLASNVWNARAHAWKAFVAAAGSFLVPSIVVVAYFYSHGLAAQYFQAVIDANLAYVAARPSVAEIAAQLPRSFVLPIAAIIAAIGVVWRRPARGPVLVVGWAVAAAIDVVLPGQFWPHYFLLIMPAAALSVGHIADSLYDARPRLAAIAVPVALLAVSNPMGVYRDALKMQAFADHDAPRIIANAIREDTSPGDSIFVFNYQPILYFLTGSKLPTRHVFPADWARRFSAVSGIDPARELDAIFREQPEFVVFLDNDWIGMGDAVFDDLRRRLSGYERQFEIVDKQIMPDPTAVEVYRRKSGTALSGGE